MQVELQLSGFIAEIESKIQVWYKNNVVGEYQADVFVNNNVIVELKVAKD